MDLVIMAAGMGSRFGGLKQIEPINDNGEFIIDYSIYDAIKAGFDKVIFVIKEENYDKADELVDQLCEMTDGLNEEVVRARAIIARRRRNL